MSHAPGQPPVPKVAPELIAAWAQGVEHFNSGRHWHAHEDWELGWTRLPEPLKTHLQAMIQVAAVLHLLKLGRARPALALCDRALRKIAQTAPAVEACLPRVTIHGAVPVLEAFQREGAASEAGLLAAWPRQAETLRAELLLPFDSRGSVVTPRVCRT